MKVDRTTPYVNAPYGGTMMPRSSILKLGLAALLVPVVGNCSPAPAPVSQSAKDPSNPNAPEGMSPMTSAPPPVRAARAPGNGQHGHAAHAAHSMSSSDGATEAGGQAVVYVCPMHPEVTSTQPDQLCPKCNMKLVPEK